MLTIPNLVSAIRLGAVPVFLWLLLGRDDPAAAGWLLAAIGATDWVDGVLARRLGQVSKVGEFLDPLADRFAVGAAVIGGWISGALPWPIALAIVVREALVSAGALVLAVRARAKLDVRYIGKIATFGLYVAIPSFLVFEGTAIAFFGWVAWLFVVPGLVLYYAVAGQYAADMLQALRERAAVSSPDPTTGAQG